MRKSRRKRKTPKRVLRLPDLDFAKGAVLNTLGSPASKRAYEFAIDDFVTWYCSEPRLAFSKTAVLRYRLELESRQLSPATTNLRLAAVRRLAYEAADTGLLSSGRKRHLIPNPELPDEPHESNPEAHAGTNQAQHLGTAQCGDARLIQAGKQR